MRFAIPGNEEQLHMGSDVELSQKWNVLGSNIHYSLESCVLVKSADWILDPLHKVQYTQ